MTERKTTGSISNTHDVLIAGGSEAAADEGIGGGADDAFVDVACKVIPSDEG